MAWSLDINGTTSSLTDLGLQNFDLQMRNLGDDLLTIHEAAGTLNDTPAMTYGQTVKLIQDATTRFIGTVDTSPKSGLPGRIERRSYTARNIFWSLNRVLYEQLWHSDATTTYYKGRVKLGRDGEDDQISIGAAIKDVLDFAIAQGLSFSYVQADLDALSQVPPDTEALDVTCFEAVKSLLKWSPSVATEVEYTTGAPVIRFIKRAAATGVSVASDGLAALEITPRHDLKVDGVIFNFEKTNTIGGDTYTSVTTQTAGTTTGLNVLKQTIDLEGINANTVTQDAKVVVEAVPDTLTPTSEDWKTFWQTYYPGLSTATGLTIESGTFPASVLTHPNILKEGSVPEWTEKTTVKAVFQGVVSGTLGSNKFESLPIAVELTLTDATTKTYSQVISSSYTPAEPAPTGLADTVYAERSVLHYQGSAQQVAAEPDFSLSTADVINLTAPPGMVWDDSGTWVDADTWDGGDSGMAGLTAINAVVESIRISRTPSAAATVIAFGPPRHLQAQDFVALARATRERVGSHWSRKAPAASGDSVDSSGGAPIFNAGAVPALPTSTEDYILKGNADGGWDVQPAPGNELPSSTAQDLLYCASGDSWEAMGAHSAADYAIMVRWSAAAAGWDFQTPPSNDDGKKYVLAFHNTTSPSEGYLWEEHGAGSEITDGTVSGDLLMWDGDSWEPLARPSVPSVLVNDGNASCRWQPLTQYKYLTSNGSIAECDYVRAYPAAP